MLTSTQIFASKIIFWHASNSPVGPCWKNAILNLLQFVFASCWRVWCMSDTINILNLFLGPFMASWLPKTFFFHLSQFPLATTATNSRYGHIMQQTKILLLLRCIGASDWSRDWWTTNQNDCLILSYDVLSVSWELRKHKVHCHYPTTQLALEF